MIRILLILLMFCFSVNGAVFFNGSATSRSQAITENNFDMTSGQYKFTVSFWLNFQRAITQETVCGKVGGAPTYTGWYIDLRTQGLSMYLISNYQTHDCIAIYLNKPLNTEIGGWHHWVITYNGSGLLNGVTGYMDGTQIPTVQIVDANCGTTLTGNLSNSIPMYFAWEGLQANYFKGYMADYRFYNKWFSSAEVYNLYNDSLQANYDNKAICILIMDESGNFHYDSSATSGSSFNDTGTIWISSACKPSRILKGE